MLTLSKNVLGGNIHGRSVQCSIRLSPAKFNLQAGKYLLVHHGKSPILGIVLRLEASAQGNAGKGHSAFEGIKGHGVYDGMKKWSAGEWIKTPEPGMQSGWKVEPGVMAGHAIKFLPGTAKYTYSAGIKWGNVMADHKMISPELQSHKDGGKPVMAKLFYNPMDEPGATIGSSLEHKMAQGKAPGPGMGSHLSHKMAQGKAPGPMPESALDHKWAQGKVTKPGSQLPLILVCAGDIPGYRALVAGAGFGDICALILTAGPVEVLIEG